MTANPPTVNPWHCRAAELARWVLVRVVNRTDRRGGYYKDNDGKTRQVTYPSKGPRPNTVTTHLLTGHFRATETRHVIGFHALGSDSHGKWVGIDIDNHDDKGDPKANQKFALAIYACLVELGFRPLLYESNGKGGYHLVVLFSTPVLGRILYQFARWLVREHQEHGFEKPPETFPKQEELGEGKEWGSWLRVVGRHHTYDIWPRVWNGAEWIVGETAVGHVLSLTGDNPDLIPFEVIAASGESRDGEQSNTHERSGWETLPGDDYNRRAQWPEILTAHGWKFDHKQGDVEHWTRPGKNSGTSATLGFCNGDGFKKFYVWTDNAPPLEQHETYSPFWAHVVLNHKGNAKAAFSDLADKSYGKRKPLPQITGITNGTHTTAQQQRKPCEDISPLCVTTDRKDTEALRRCHIDAQTLTADSRDGLQASAGSRDVFVIGTNANPDAVTATARTLTNSSEGKVFVATPPAGYQTISAWVEDIRQGWGEAEDWDGAREQITAYLHDQGKAVSNNQPPPPPADPFDAGMNLADLIATDLPPPKFLLDNFLPEGLSVLAGRPKQGKSWLAMLIAIAVSGGRDCLGSSASRQRDVLHLALEDTRRRYRDRAGKILRGLMVSANKRLDVRTSWPRAGAGGLFRVAEWFKVHPGGLVIVDTLARFRDRSNGRGNGYEDDYNSVAELKKVADQYEGAALVVSHTRKSPAEDPFDEISGTLGINGGADTLMVLERQRGENTAAFYMTGRDLAEQTLALLWNGEFGLWSRAGHVDGIVRQERVEQPNRVGRAMVWLRGFLTVFAFPDAEIMKAGERHGHTEEAIKKAKARLRDANPPLVSRKRGFGAGIWWNWIGPDTKPDRTPAALAELLGGSSQNGENGDDNAIST
jgi:hypothetical protein